MSNSTVTKTNVSCQQYLFQHLHLPWNWLGYSFLLLQDDLTVSCRWRGWSFLSIYLIAIYLVKRPCSVFANGWQVLVHFAYPGIQWLTERLFKSARGFRTINTDILKTPTTGLSKNHSQSTIRQITSLNWTKETTWVIATKTMQKTGRKAFIRTVLGILLGVEQICQNQMVNN